MREVGGVENEGGGRGGEGGGIKEMGLTVVLPVQSYVRDLFFSVLGTSATFSATAHWCKLKKVAHGAVARM